MNDQSYIGEIGYKSGANLTQQKVDDQGHDFPVGGPTIGTTADTAATTSSTSGSLISWIRGIYNAITSVMSWTWATTSSDQNFTTDNSVTPYIAGTKIQMFAAAGASKCNFVKPGWNLENIHASTDCVAIVYDGDPDSGGVAKLTVSLTHGQGIKTGHLGFLGSANTAVYIKLSAAATVVANFWADVRQ